MKKVRILLLLTLASSGYYFHERIKESPSQCETSREAQYFQCDETNQLIPEQRAGVGAYCQCLRGETRRYFWTAPTRTGR